MQSIGMPATDLAFVQHSGLPADAVCEAMRRV